METVLFTYFLYCILYDPIGYVPRTIKQPESVGEKSMQYFCIIPRVFITYTTPIIALLMLGTLPTKVYVHFIIV